MSKKFFCFIAILITLTLLFAGCLNKKIKLDYIEKPNEMTIKSYDNKDKITELMFQITDMRKKGVRQEEQEKVLREVEKLTSESTLKVNDKEFINKVMNEVIYSGGTLEGQTITIPSKDEIVFSIEFPYTVKSSSTPEKSSLILLNEIMIFSDSMALINVYDKDSPQKFICVKNILSKETVKYITDFYSSKK